MESSGSRCSNLYCLQKICEWIISSLEEYNPLTEEWEPRSHKPGYWIYFASNGQCKNSNGDKGEFSISGNLIDIGFIYGESFKWKQGC